MGAQVLIVDDSASVRQQVGMALSQAGFEIIEACDGNEGISAVSNNPNLAIVISDVNMPNMDGLIMVSKLKSDPANNSLPIIMLTTEGQPALIRKAKEAGAVGWIVKPFDAEQLVATVKKITG